MQAFSETLSRTGAATFQAYPTPQKDLDNFNVLNLRREEIDSNYCERHLTRWVAGEEPSGGGKATLIRPKGIVERETSAYYPTAPEWLPATVGFIRREFCKGISATDVFRMVGLSHTIVEKAFRRHLRTTRQSNRRLCVTDSTARSNSRARHR